MATAYDREQGQIVVFRPTRDRITGTAIAASSFDADDFDDSGTTSVPVAYDEFEIAKLTVASTDYYIQCRTAYSDDGTGDDLTVTGGALAGNFAENWRLVSGPGAILSVNSVSYTDSETTTDRPKVDVIGSRTIVTGNDFSVTCDFDFNRNDKVHHLMRRGGILGSTMFFPDGPVIGGGLFLFTGVISASANPEAGVVPQQVTITQEGAARTYREAVAADLIAFQTT